MTIEYETPGGGGGVADHGALTGLTDDDHSQYHNNSRADTWLATSAAAAASIIAAGVTPVAADLAARGNETLTVVKGTGGRKFLGWKDSAGSFFVEMGVIA